jgi:hypothetical protein
MSRIFRTTYIFALITLLLLAAVWPVHADDAAPVVAPTTSPLIITEIQTGGATASDEFIELYNQSSAPVDLGGWQVRYRNATSSTSTLGISLTPYTLAPGAHFVLHTPSVALPTGTPSQEYAATLSSTDKAIGLFAPDAAACQAVVRDAVAWGASTQGEGAPLVMTDPASPHHYVYRYVDAAQTYSDTASNVHDFGAAPGAPPTPGAINTQLLPVSAAPAAPGGPSPLAAVALKGCSLPQPGRGAEPPAGSNPPVVPVAPTPPPVTSVPTDAGSDDKPEGHMPARNDGLFAPQISELLPNPAKPQTDADHEFIELYNPNAQPFELSGFALEVGTKTKKRYTFPQGTLIAGKSFAAYYAKDTNLTLSNTQGQVWLVDPLDRVVGQSDPYASAKDGQAWLFAKAWQWTLTPTPGKVNALQAPAAKKTAAKTSSRDAATGTVAAAQDSTGAGSAPGSTTKADDADSSFNPLHPGVLAATGVIAVLYGLYEYRRDVANKFHQFRRNRAARREARQSLPGR